MKKCTKCGLSEHETSFYKRKNGKGGFSAQCRDCRMQYIREYKRKNPGKLEQIAHDHYLRNRDKRMIQNKLWAVNNPDRYAIIRRKNSWKFSGIIFTEEQYQTMLAEQKGLCAVCKEPSKEKRFMVDHNHKTGYIRGLLCRRCNRFVVMTVEKYGSLIEPAKVYLNKEVA